MPAAPQMGTHATDCPTPRARLSPGAAAALAIGAVSAIHLRCATRLVGCLGACYTYDLYGGMHRRIHPNDASESLGLNVTAETQEVRRRI